MSKNNKNYKKTGGYPKAPSGMIWRRAHDRKAYTRVKDGKKWNVRV